VEEYYGVGHHYLYYIQHTCKTYGHNSNTKYSTLNLIGTIILFLRNWLLGFLILGFWLTKLIQRYGDKIIQTIKLKLICSTNNILGI